MTDTAHEGLRIGRYELVTRLGSGGMGDVWESILHGPEGFRKHVALKLLRRPDVDADGRALVQEARLGALLSHPNVVATHDLGVEDGRWYLAMELVRGPSLADLVRTRPLPALAVIEAGLAACAGLAHIHALRVDDRPAGLVHRDLKPSNLLLDRSGLVKIADLGIARLCRATGDASGTPGFLSPEQGEGREDHRCDLFALGVTLFVLATGDWPFGSGVRALLEVGRVEEHLASGLTAPLDTVLPGLGAVVARCLRFDPDARWADAESLGEALAGLRPSAGGDSLSSVLLQARPDLLPELATTPRIVRDRASARTVALAVGNLPPQRDAFFGRRTELENLAVVLLEGERNVVLKGPGGMGKTRLSLAVAREVADELPGGCWFVELAGATTVDGICAAVSVALMVPLGHQDPVRQLARAMAYRGRALFVFDNCEQVAHALPETLGRWLDLAPQALFLSTSRVAPRLTGERVVELDPLAADDAVELFLDRCPRPPGAAERPLVELLVDELERLPLAIELAAARTRVMSVERVRHRLSDRLRLLSEGDRDRPARQRSMTASLDASWELASAAARTALVELTVFEGGFTLEAAEGTVDLREVPDARWMVDIVAELVDASLVRADADGTRFRMAVLVSEWARTHAARGQLAAAAARHAAWFSQWGDEDTVAYFRRAGGEPFRQVLQDVENVIAAAHRMLDLGNDGLAARLAHAALGLLVIRGPLGPVFDLGARVIALPGVTDRDRCRLWFVLAAAYADGGARDDANHALSEALRLAEAGGDDTTVVGALGMAARLAQREGRTADAAAMLARAAGLAQRAGPEAQLSALVHEGLVHVSAGRLREAMVPMREVLRLAQARRDARRQTIAHNNLGLLHLYLRDLDAAAEHMEAAQTLGLQNGDRRGEVVASANLGSVRFQRGDLEGARAAFVSSLRVLGETGDESGSATSELLLAKVEHEAGFLGAARRRLVASLDGKRRVGAPFGEMQVNVTWGAIEVDAGGFSEARGLLETAARWGHRAKHLHLVALAESGLANLAIATGELAAALPAIERAEAAAEAVQTDRALPWLARGRWCVSTGDREGAIDAFGRALADARGSDFVIHAEARLGLAGVMAPTPAALAEIEAVLREATTGGLLRLQGLALAQRAAWWSRSTGPSSPPAREASAATDHLFATLGYAAGAPRWS